ncbi:MAG: long-chain fatty acid--CoA ligase [Burkholderiales bacterium]|nr:long-chain fatty acid--CoA ligase [Phycisphaerae bacterium]
MQTPTNHWRLWDRILDTARRAPSRAAYIDVKSGETLTYHDLVTGVQNEPSAADYRVLLRSPNALAFPVRLLAHLLAGRAVLPMSCDASELEVQRAIHATGNLTPSGDEAGEILLSSSGTTGLPKIVRRSRGSLDSIAAAMTEAIGFTEADRVIAAVPLTHSYGLEHGLLAPLWAGCTVLLCRGLNVGQIADAINRGATIFPAVPAMIELLTTIHVQEFSNHGLRTVYSAGAPLPPIIAEAFAHRFGVRVGQVYGLTEVGSVLYSDPHRHLPETVGAPVAGVSLRIVPTNRGDQECASGEEGEVAIRAASMLSGYVNEPLHLIDGYFPTGDLGRVTSGGELTITGRVRLLIDVGGAKVNPLEVEDVLSRHPQVAACVVLPLKLTETIQKVRAIVVLVDPASPPDPAELRRFVRSELAAYKVPRGIEFRNSLPRSPTGKILRNALESA